MNTRKTPSRRFRRESSAPAAVRIKRPHTPAQSEKNSPRNRYVFPLTSTPVVSLFLVCCVLLVGAWLFLSSDKKIEPAPSWQACIPQKSHGFSENKESHELTFLTVPAGTYDMPSPHSGLFPLLRPYAMKTVLIDQTFMIQEQLIPHALFTQYARFVEKLSDGDDKTDRQARIGLLWNRITRTTPSAYAISWEAAVDFSDWLSKKTGCAYTLPSREQWLAAIIWLYNSGEPAPRLGNTVRSTPMEQMLRSGREWTRSDCATGYYLVGADNWVTEPETDQTVCMPPLVAMAGFRVVLNPANLPVITAALPAATQPHTAPPTSTPTSTPASAPTSTPTSAPASAPALAPALAPASAPTSAPTSAPALAPASDKTTDTDAAQKAIP